MLAVLQLDEARMPAAYPRNSDMTRKNMSCVKHAVGYSSKDEIKEENNTCVPKAPGMKGDKWVAGEEMAVVGY